MPRMLVEVGRIRFSCLVWAQTVLCVQAVVVRRVLEGVRFVAVQQLHVDCHDAVAHKWHRGLFGRCCFRFARFLARLQGILLVVTCCRTCGAVLPGAAGEGVSCSLPWLLGCAAGVSRGGQETCCLELLFVGLLCCFRTRFPSSWRCATCNPLVRTPVFGRWSSRARQPV
jgi:hypothetical protein